MAVRHVESIESNHVKGKEKAEQASIYNTAFGSVGTETAHKVPDQERAVLTSLLVLKKSREHTLLIEGLGWALNSEKT